MQSHLLFITTTDTTTSSGAKGKPTATQPTCLLQEVNTKCERAEASPFLDRTRTQRVLVVLTAAENTYLKATARFTGLGRKA